MTARPGKVKEIIDVTLPRPRTEDIRNSFAFAEIRQYAWSLIKDEVGKAQALQENQEAAAAGLQTESLAVKVKNDVLKRIGWVQ
jgi:NitT/TauT family transport system ATP-binding protein